MNIPSLSNNETIRRIEQLGGTYDPDPSFDLMDQLLICETLKDSTPIRDFSNIEEKGTNENGSDNGSVNGSYKRTVNTVLSQSKHETITKLKACTYRTNPAIISSLLDEIFSGYPSKPGYWFSVAQRWPPRRINQVLNYLIKLEFPGHITTRNPAAYFTFLIRRRQERKKKV